MTTALLEINDFSIKASTSDNNTYNECGFAHVTDSGIITGDKGFEAFWRHPEKCSNNYWLFLDQQPLKTNWKWARHNADLAYAQLDSTLKSIGSPDEVVLCVSNTISVEQLSLLAGLLKALNISIKRIVDLNLFAGLAMRQSAWLIDMQLHQATLTLVEKSISDDQEIFSIKESETLPNFGFMHICNTIARDISKKLINNSRFDPMHSSGSAQDLYNQIKSNINEFEENNELNFQIKSPSGIVNITINPSELKNLFKKELSKINRKVVNSGDMFSLKDSAHMLEKLLDTSGNYLGLAPSYDINAIEKLLNTSQFDKNKLVKINAIKLAKAEESLPKTRTNHTATHLLYDNHAWDIRNEKSIQYNNQGLQIKVGVDKTFDLAFILKDGKLEIYHQSSSKEIVIPKTFKEGEQIIIDNAKINLIKVENA
ncbi:MAG: hypothetical protein VXY95_07005 [Pseudomonadota bacterium]|jgi:hypothetical protein|nr:hypothetical protein [Porticoccaceae bacterium]MEC8471017.1 hypothetical protein [Pseudomonadota bacterium]|tara:strand:- start:1 stop:1281 length:1281 start_codon:yes stop_codon:yes gene_type:complete